MGVVKIGKPLAIGLTLVTGAGAVEVVTASALRDGGQTNRVTANRHTSNLMAHDTGASGGTIVHPQAEGGYLEVGPGQPVEQPARRPAIYRGGSFSDYIA
jgi:hypothetical protein